MNLQQSDPDQGYYVPDLASYSDDALIMLLYQTDGFHYGGIIHFIPQIPSAYYLLTVVFPEWTLFKLPPHI
jgi:hypothetical protein